MNFKKLGPNGHIISGEDREFASQIQEMMRHVTSNIIYVSIIDEHLRIN